MKCRMHKNEHENKSENAETENQKFKGKQQGMHNPINLPPEIYDVCDKPLTHCTHLTRFNGPVLGLV